MSQALKDALMNVAGLHGMSTQHDDSGVYVFVP